MRFLFATALILFAFPALAERQWLSPEEFETKVTGRATQIYHLTGELYGTEYFLPKRRVIWQKAGETTCFSGTWAPNNDLVCFRYEGSAGSCNKYYVEADKLVSVDFVGGVQTSMAYSLQVANESPPDCVSN
jgi:hypothetical protein